MALQTELPFSNDVDWNEYWNRVYYWPLRLVIVVALLILLWKKFDSDQPFYGLTIKNFKWKPYGLIVPAGNCSVFLAGNPCNEPDAPYDRPVARGHFSRSKKHSEQKE